MPNLSNEKRTPAEIKAIEAAIDGIVDGFNWDKTEQGFEYWSHVVNALGVLIGRRPNVY